MKRVYLVGPRPIYPNNPNARYDGCVIVEAEPQFEGEPAKALAMKLAKDLAEAVRSGHALSCDIIASGSIADYVARGAQDLRGRLGDDG